MKITLAIIGLIFSTYSTAEISMPYSPPSSYKTITKSNALDYGIGVSLLPGEGAECHLIINILDTHGARKIRFNLIQRSANGSTQMNKLGIEKIAKTGSIFGSIILDSNAIQLSTAEIVMHKTGNNLVFHGTIQLNDFGTCQF
jgi:hypothetical protein